MVYLEQALNKPISYFSSGMKQRLKLGICLFSEASLVLLDEPTSNLDERGISWYLEMIEEQTKHKCVLIASNDSREYGFCQNRIRMEDYKNKISL
jgi:ABC-type multidrug transport system ATPase subunit